REILPVERLGLASEARRSGRLLLSASRNDEKSNQANQHGGARHSVPPSKRAHHATSARSHRLHDVRSDVAYDVGVRRRILFALVTVSAALIAGVAGLVLVDVYLHHRVQNLGGVNVWGYRGPAVGRKQAGETRI